jgi:hypothetical protein
MVCPIFCCYSFFDKNNNNSYYTKWKTAESLPWSIYSNAESSNTNTCRRVFGGTVNNKSLVSETLYTSESQLNCCEVRRVMITIIII